MKADNPDEAIDEFLGLPALEDEKGDWGFKGLKQAVKLEFKLGKYDKVKIHIMSDELHAYSIVGCRTLHRASNVRQKRSHTKLL